MRLLCINPNTSADMTATVVAALKPFLPQTADIVPVTGQFGAPYISTRATFAIGGHAALHAFAHHAQQPWDAVLLACFGDPAVFALREIAEVPVIGMAEAAMQVAARAPGAFSIVTGGKAWEPMLKEFAAQIGLADRLASTRATTATGGDIFRNPQAAIAQLATEIAACQHDGAQRVILGGAGLAGLAAQLRPLVTVPVIDCVEALAVVACEAIAADRTNGLVARNSPQAAELAAQSWFQALR